MLTTPLALALMLAPTVPPDRAPFDVSDAELVTVDDVVHVVTYDAEGEQTAALSVWLDDDGRTHLDADFADGLYLSVVTDGEDVTVDSPDSVEVAARAEAISAWVGENGQQASWREYAACGLHVALAVVECSPPLVVVGCGFGLVGTYCHCAPLLSEEAGCQ